MGVFRPGGEEGHTLRINSKKAVKGQFFFFIKMNLYLAVCVENITRAGKQRRKLQ